MATYAYQWIDLTLINREIRISASLDLDEIWRGFASRLGSTTRYRQSAIEPKHFDIFSEVWRLFRSVAAGPHERGRN